MAVTARGAGSPDDEALRRLFVVIASGDGREATRLLESDRELVTRPIRVGATRHDADRWFLAGIRHHVYAGDTALHVAAAAHQPAVVRLLIAAGADARARNRRGAEPLHVAADGRPGADDWDPTAQAGVVTLLIEAGADPNALDRSGVAPLHRAVRTRAPSAVSVLIAGGADPLLKNRSGSTPLHLAVQSTGRSDAGSEAAKDGQRRIIGLLLAAGARATDTDSAGKTVAAAANNDAIRSLPDGC